MKKIILVLIAAVPVAVTTLNNYHKKTALTAQKSFDIAGSYKMTRLSVVTPSGEVNYTHAAKPFQQELLTLWPDKRYSYNGAGLNSTLFSIDAGVWDMQGKDSLLLNGFPVSIVSATHSQLVLLADRSDDGIGLVFKTTYERVAV